MEKVEEGRKRDDVYGEDKINEFLISTVPKMTQIFLACQTLTDDAETQINIIINDGS